MQGRWIGSALSAIALMALAAGLAGCGPDRRLAEAPVAVVLHEDGHTTRMSAVDLSSMKVLSSHKLRSQCFSMDGDIASRVVITAQTGGIGPDADDAAGVWDLAQDQVHYVTLPYPNPSSVVVARDTGYVLHGFQLGDSLVLSTVRLTGGNRIATGTVSEWAQDPESVAGGVYVPVSASRNAKDGYTASSGSIEYLTGSLTESRVVEIARRAMRIVADPLDSKNLILLGSVGDPEPGSPGKWRITRIDRATGRILEDQPLVLEYGVMSVCAVGDALAIADANGLDMEDPGGSVLILDGKTLGERRRVQVQGMASAVAAWGERLLVFDGVKGDLALFATGSGQLIQKLQLTGGGGGTGDIVVFDATRAERE